MATKKVEKLARALFIKFGFKFYGNDGESSWHISRQGKDKDGKLNGIFTSESGGDCGELNRKAAKELWDTGKYEINDFGGDDFSFTCDEKEKEVWRRKARELMKG